jgi:hypothetical protein
LTSNYTPGGCTDVTAVPDNDLNQEEKLILVAQYKKEKKHNHKIWRKTPAEGGIRESGRRKKYARWVSEARKEFVVKYTPQILTKFQECGLANAMDGSEDHKIKIKDGKKLFDMSSIFPLSKYENQSLHQRDEEDFSESDLESEDEEDDDDKILVIPRKRKKSKKALNKNNQEEKILKKKKKIPIRIPKKKEKNNYTGKAEVIKRVAKKKKPLPSQIPTRKLKRVMKQNESGRKRQKME